MKKIKISWSPLFGNHRSFAKNARRRKQKRNIRSYCFTLDNYGKLAVNIPVRMVKKRQPDKIQKMINVYKKGGKN